MAIARKQYEKLINKAFIDPIRSVLIIDDEYPTWKKIFENSSSPETPPSKKVYDTIKAFRNEHPFMIVDIDDGGNLSTSNASNLAKHFTQSDLVVLDYEIDKTSKKSEIFTKKIMNNDQFNLIIIHTQESQLRIPFEAIIQQLLCPMVRYRSAMLKIKSFSKDPDHENMLGECKKSVTIDAYLKYRKYSSLKYKEYSPWDVAYEKAQNGELVFAQIMEIINKAKAPLCQHKSDILYWSMREFEEERKFTGKKDAQVTWSLDKPYWIRTNRGFITFASKKKDTDLIGVLREALHSWGPKPTRLLSTKLRNEIAKKGVIAEDVALSNNNVQGRFFKHLQDQTESKHVLESYMHRHFESLFQEISEDVQCFSKGVLDATQNGQLKKWYSVEDEDKDEDKDKDKEALMKATHEYNAHISCINPKAPHLMTGHIFTIPEKTRGNKEEHWICLSPACDLVPGQSAKGIDCASGILRPFIAAKLEPKEINNKPKDTEKKINSGNFIFVPNNSTKTFYIYPNSSSNQINPQPEWRLFVAKDDGKLLTGLKFSLFRLNGKTDELKPILCEATIIARLRSEYAINLAQKLGANMTRVGLEYLI